MILENYIKLILESETGENTKKSEFEKLLDSLIAKHNNEAKNSESSRSQANQITSLSQLNTDPVSYNRMISRDNQKKKKNN